VHWNSDRVANERQVRRRELADHGKIESTGRASTRTNRSAVEAAPAFCRIENQADKAMDAKASSLSSNEPFVLRETTAMILRQNQKIRR
jgi:hypothetical protein